MSESTAEDTCRKSTTGRHDFYVMRPVIDPADACRWCGRVATRAAPTPDWSEDRRVIEWLVWFARKTKGKAADVARQAMDQNPGLRAPTPELADD